MAININDELQEVLNQAGVKDPSIRTAILKAAKELETEKKNDKEESNEPKAKSEFVIFVRGDAAVKAAVQAGWVAQVKQGEDIANLTQKMKQAVKEHNAAQKRKKRFITTWSEMFQYIKRPFSKANGFQPKTKVAVQVVVLEAENV